MFNKKYFGQCEDDRLGVLMPQGLEECIWITGMMEVCQILVRYLDLHLKDEQPF